MAAPLLIQALIVIAASAFAVAIFAAARLPVAMGYLVAGLVIGPHGLGLVAASEETRFLAELGLVFLMFMVGLEFSLPKMLAARAEVLGAGSLQVGLTVLVGAGCAYLLGVSGPGVLVIGAALATSSTAISLKQLTEQGEISSAHGRLALGILLFQDLATLPFLVMIGAWSARSEPTAIAIVQQFAVAAIALAAAATLSRPLVHRGLFWMARLRSVELFLLTVLLVTLATASAVQLAGLTPPIGAFIAGMVIGESDFRHQVEEDIRPFRDVLVGLFFVTVGMAIDPSIITLSPWAVLAWTAAFLVGKPSLTFLALALLRRPPHVAFRVAVILAHGGELGLLLLTQAMAAAILAPDVGQPLLVALAATMGTAPLLIERSGPIARLVAPLAHPGAGEAEVREASDSLDHHVLLCGCGRVGRLVAAALDAAKLPYLALESDVTRLREAQRQGHHVVFGDASRRRFLEAGGVSRARLIIVTFDRRHTVERILHLARRYNPKIATIVSAADDREIASFVEAGASAVFPENLAAGLGLADQTLLLCGLSQDEAARIVTALRIKLNPELRDCVGI